jgi:hypothetical protein
MMLIDADRVRRQLLYQDSLMNSNQGFDLSNVYFVSLKNIEKQQRKLAKMDEFDAMDVDDDDDDLLLAAG